jgi:basic membrane protein A and related proteins
MKNGQKRFLTLLLIIPIALAILSCSKKEQSKDEQYRKRIKIGLVLDKGGRDDKSFNSAAYEGTTRAGKEFNIFTKTVEASDDSAFEPLQRTMAERNFDLIIGVGFAQEEYIRKIATDFPDVHFAIVDSKVELPNVASLLFKEHEGSFLVGMIAALKNKTGTIGFVGGMDIPLIRKFLLGYQEGARYVNPAIKIVANFTGVTPEAWNNPTKGKELANAQYSQGADIIFQAAGASGAGVFDSAEENKKFAIGVDSNQNWVKPGYILTSMLKKVNVAVYEVIKSVVEKKFNAGVHYFGLDNNGVDYAMDQYNKDLISKEILDKVEQAKKDIIAGKIKVTNYYEVMNKK